MSFRLHSVRSARPEPEAATGPAEALNYVLSGLRLPVSYNREVLVDRNEDGGFVAREVILPLEAEIVRVEGTIDSSLFVNARNAGVPISVLIELVRIFSSTSIFSAISGATTNSK
jgi:hypothetical protein